MKNLHSGTETDGDAERTPACGISRHDSRPQVADRAVDYTQTLADHRVLASVGSIGDAYDNALAESFVDTFKTEMIADRVWRSRSQLELAVVELHRLVQRRPPARKSRRYPTARIRAAAQ